MNKRKYSITMVQLMIKCFSRCMYGFIVYARVRLLVPGHFYFYAVSKFSLRENDISVLLL